MNVFKETKNILGEVNAKELGVAFAEFMELARSIREKLGCRKYLLDWYLLRLLEMANTFSYLDLSDDGEETGGKLRKLCRQVLRGEDAVGETRIGSTVQAYVATHPYPFHEKCLPISNNNSCSKGVGAFSFCGIPSRKSVVTS